MSKNKKALKIILTFVIIGVFLFMVPFLFSYGSILKEALFDRPSRPRVEYGEFPFELVYEYNGQQYTVTETIVCDYEGISFALDGGNSRGWNCYITNNEEYGRYYLERGRYESLYIQVPLEADYYMGDPECNEDVADPYIYFIDEDTGTTYYEQDLSDVVGAKIISWKPSSPLENNIK